jgi:iron complex outermembrane receptor protein
LNLLRYIFLTILCYINGAIYINAQVVQLKGCIRNGTTPIPYASVYLKKTSYATVSNNEGIYLFNTIPAGDYTLVASCLGFKKFEKMIQINQNYNLDIALELDENKLTEFVITGVSKATRMKENPLPMSNIGLKNIEQSSESNLMDVIQKNSTGVSMLKTGPNISKPFIRGLGYNRVLTLYDGIRQEGQQWGDEHGIEIDAYDMQNIEIIKGPASLMYGSDAVAGVVSFIPQDIDTAAKGIHGKLINEYQHNNNLIGNGAYLFQSKKLLSFKVGGSHRLAKNFRNAADGRVYNTGYQEINLSGSILMHLKNSTLSLKSTFYENIQGIPDGSRDSSSRQFTYQQYEGDLDDIKNRPIVSKHQLNSYAPADLHQQIKHYRIYVKQAIEIKKSKVTYLLALQKNIRKEITHPSNLKQAGLFIHLNTLNYHLMYHFPETKNSTTAIGINGMVQVNKNKDATDFPIPNYQLFDAGLFAHHTRKFDQLNVSGGLRCDIRKVTFDDLYTFEDPIIGFSYQTDKNSKPESYHQYQFFERNFNGLSGSTGFSYIFNSLWHIKINFSRGYRAPGVTELASNGLDPGARIIYLGNQNFKPEFSNQQDIGLFFEGKDIDASLGVFNNFIQNYIYLSQLADANNEPIVDAQGNKTFQYQQSKAQLYGLEASFNIHPQKWGGFMISNNFQSLYAYNRDQIFAGTGINGAYLPFIPPTNFSTQISHHIQIRKSKIKQLTPKFEIEYFAKQSRFMALYGTETATPAYYLMHASLQLEFFDLVDKKLLLNLFANNFTNQVYQSNMSRLKYFEYFKDNRANSNGIYNMGRNLGLKLIYKF